MREITVCRLLDARPAKIWSILADFPNVAAWNSSVTKSFATSAETEGVGAQRHCDLRFAGGLEETVTEWVPQDRMVVRIDSTAMMPVRDGVVGFALTRSGSGTEVTITFSYRSWFGPLERLVGPPLDAQLTKGLNGLLDDLEAAAG